MKIIACLTFAMAVFGMSVEGYGADVTATASPRLGEVRAIAVAPANAEAVAALHREGWLEANGELLSTEAFPELFQIVGRAWTAEGVPDDRFAVPRLRERSSGAAAANPFGVLGPGDLVTGGRVRNAWTRAEDVAQWIYAGRDTTGAGQQTARR